MEDVRIIVSRDASRILWSVERIIVAVLSEVVLKAEENLGLFLLRDIEGRGIECLKEMGFINAVDKISYDGKVYEVENVFMLNPDMVWKGIDWARGIVEYRDRCLFIRQPWLPAIDYLYKLHLIQ